MGNTLNPDSDNDDDLSDISSAVDTNSTAIHDQLPLINPMLSDHPKFLLKQQHLFNQKSDVSDQVMDHQHLIKTSIAKLNMMQQQKQRKNDKHINPFTEFIVLPNHKDIVTRMLKVDDDFMLSASDDTNIIMWNYHTGKLVHKLQGHRLQITCMELMPHPDENSNSMILLSGACDKLINMWDLNTGACLNSLQEHHGGVKAIIVLEDGKRFCSAANDSKICVWSSNGTCLKVITRQCDNNINDILLSPSNFILTASDCSSIFGYDLERFEYADIDLVGHPLGVRFLVNVNNQTFVSAGGKGLVITWSSESLKQYRKIDLNQLYGFNSINYVTKIDERTIACCVDKHFLFIDIVTGIPTIMKKNAHHADIMKLIVVHSGDLLITCSEDSEIRIWRTGREEQLKKRTPLKKLKSTSKIKGEPHDPECLGILSVHTGSVKDITMLNNHMFASCGSDKNVIVWKDSELMDILESYYAFKFNISYHTPKLESIHEKSNVFKGISDT